MGLARWNELEERLSNSGQNELSIVVGQEASAETGFERCVGRAIENGPKAQLIVVQDRIDLRIVEK